MALWTEIERNITEATGKPLAIASRTAVGGGCINEAFVVSGADRRYFVKLNHVDGRDMFDAEVASLREIAASRSIRVPEPVAWGVAENRAFLAMEYIPLGSGERQTPERLAQDLARMHRHVGKNFGWHRDNTIGSTPQINTAGDHWPEFWRRYRLGYQLELAARNGYTGRLQQRGERLMSTFAVLMEHGPVAASLLHGDLWSGNVAADGHGQPVIFDPATYYGDREADIAMTELFGGFPSRFYHAYRDAYPLDPGYSVRKTLYNLYHVLNHLNLFGGSYLSQAEHMIDQLLSETG